MKRPRKKGRKRPPRDETFVWLEQVISANLPALFPGMDVIEAHPFHVTRDADIAIKELEAEDLLETIEEGVRQRRFGSVVRLMVSDDMPAHILDILMNNLEIDASQVYRMRGPLSLSRLMHLYSLDRPDLKDAPFMPAVPKPLVAASAEEDIFALIRRQNILLHHPFDSFQPVVDFLKKAARDPNVLAIKMVSVPRWPELAGGGSPAGGERGRQAGGGAGGTESALRRGEQHRVGPRAGKRRRTRGVRPVRAEDALQGY